MENNTVAEPESGATQKKGMLPLIGAILALAVIAISILCGCLGGLVPSQKLLGGNMGVFEFFNFGKGSVWDSLIARMKTTTGPDMGTLVQYVLGTISVAVMLILLLAMLIRGIIMFVRGLKSGDFRKTYGSAYGAYAAFLGTQVAILSFFAGEYGLNAAAIAGAVIGGLLIGATIVLRFLPSAKDVFADNKKVLHFILTACGTVCTVVVLGLAGQPLIKSGEVELSFLQYLNIAHIGASQTGGGHISSETLLTCLIGTISTLMVIVFALIQLIRYFKQLSEPSVEPKKFRKATWLADTVALFGLLAAVIGPAWSKTDFGPSQIVLLVFAVANFALAIVDYVKLKDKPNKQ